MSKRPTKKPPPKKPINETKLDELFVLGRDENGKPRGARFAECKDDIVTAALSLNCSVVYPASADFVKIAMKLPIGRIYASGRAFIPPIRTDLFDRLTTQLASADDTSSVHIAATTEELSTECSLPKNWDEIKSGSLVLIEESPEDGWWRAIVIDRTDEVLRLKLRDYPKLPIYVRHISTVGLVNPGP